MPYRDRLTGWLVVRLLPKMQRVVVGRFRSHSDAEGHLQALRRLIPEARLVVVFDPDLNKTESDLNKRCPLAARRSVT
jgi:hypothetical protein